MSTERATFGAGCFWGVEAAFRRVEGVVATAVGFAGGDLENPTYRDVCNGVSGHAEVVQVEFDPERVSYDQLLDVFWENHDPTTLNRQGADIGSQYRSVVFFHSPAQHSAAETSMRSLEESHRYQDRIVTTLEPASKFFVAEDYHQQYLEKRGLATCRIK